MRKIRQVIRLNHEAKLSRRAIARSLGLSRDVVADYLTRAAAARLTWPLPPALDDQELENRLFPPALEPKAARKPEPDWAIVHQELKRKGATLQVLHEEYLAEHPLGMAYSLFTQRHREFTRSIKRYLRQTYVAGERVFVDYAGPTINIIDQGSGKVLSAQLFVAVLGASNYTYAEAHWSQSLPDWIAAHDRMFQYFGAVPAVIVCDNLKAAVTKANRTEPVINATYQAMAEHYGTVVLPARPRQPKDKAKVENGVLIVERWIMFRLRKRLFTNLGDLNDAIRGLLADLNERPFQKLPGSRQRIFDEIDRPAMQPLPNSPYEYAEFRKVRIGLDYRIDVGGCTYSVPSHLVRQEVELRITSSTIEVLHKGRRIASHARSGGTAPVIDPEHMEAAHRHFAFWKEDIAIEWAGQIGANVHEFVSLVFAGFKTREQGYRTHNSLKKLAAEHDGNRLDAACRQAIELGAHSVSSVRSILRSKLDQQSAAAPERKEASFDHANVRGSKYYH